MDAGEVIEVSGYEPIFKYWEHHTESFYCLDCTADLCILDGGANCPAGYTPDKKPENTMSKQEAGKLYSKRSKKKAFSTIREIEPKFPISVKEISEITGLHTATIYNWIKRGWLEILDISPKKYIVTGANYDCEDK